MAETDVVCAWLLLAGFLLAGNFLVLADIERARRCRRARRRRRLARSLLTSMSDASTANRR